MAVGRGAFWIHIQAELIWDVQMNYVASAIAPRTVIYLSVFNNYWCVWNYPIFIKSGTSSLQENAIYLISSVINYWTADMCNKQPFDHYTFRQSVKRVLFSETALCRNLESGSIGNTWCSGGFLVNWKTYLYRWLEKSARRLQTTQSDS